MRLNLTENLPFKIVSLVMGLVLYLFVMQEKEGQRAFTVPVVVESEPENYVLLSEVPDLRVVIEGRTRNLARLGSDALSELVLRFDRPVTHRRFTPSDFALPAGVEVQSIFPEIVQLNFAPKVAAEVPIVPDRRGEPVTGYTVRWTVDPSHLRVEGPAEQINALDGIFTQPVDIQGLTEVTTRRVGLAQLGPDISYDRDTQVLVRVYPEVNEVNLEVPGVPVEVSGPADRFSVDEPTMSVVLRGPQAVIDAFDPSVLRVSVDATPYLDAPAGVYDAVPQLLNLPAELTVQSRQFDALRLTVVAPTAFECRTIPLPNVLPIVVPRIILDAAPPPEEAPAPE